MIFIVSASLETDSEFIDQEIGYSQDLERPKKSSISHLNYKTLKLLYNLVESTQYTDLEDHERYVNYLEFKSNCLITAGEDNIILIWDLLTSKIIKVYNNFDSSRNFIELSGNYLIFLTLENNLVVWNILEKRLDNLIPYDTYNINHTIIRNLNLISFDLNSAIRIWDLKTGKTNTIVHNQTQKIKSFTCSSEFAAIGEAGRVFVFDLEEKKTLVKYLGHSFVSEKIIYKKDRIIFGSWENSMNNWSGLKKASSTLNIFNTKTKKTDVRLNFCRKSLYSANYNYICYSTPKAAFRTWKLKPGKVIPDIKSISCLAITNLESNTYLLAGGIDFSITCYDLNTLAEGFKLYGHTSRINCIVITSDNSKGISCSDDTTVIVWSMATRQIELVLEGHEDNVSGVSTNDKVIVSVSWDDTIKVWEIETGILIKELYLPDCFLNCVQVSDCKEFFVIGSRSRGVSFYTLDGSFTDILTHKKIKVSCLSINKQYIAAGCTDGTVYYWNRESKVEASFRNKYSEITFISILANYILYCCSGSIGVRNIRTNNQLEFEGNLAILFTGTVQDSIGIACCNSDNCIRVTSIVPSDMNVITNKKFVLLLMYQRKVRFSNALNF
jgi:WD40 repeat protein